jgi:hypothetical protein
MHEWQTVEEKLREARVNNSVAVPLGEVPEGGDV